MIKSYKWDGPEWRCRNREAARLAVIFTERASLRLTRARDHIERPHTGRSVGGSVPLPALHRNGGWSHPLGEFGVNCNMGRCRGQAPMGRCRGQAPRSQNRDVGARDGDAMDLRGGNKSIFEGCILFFDERDVSNEGHPIVHQGHLWHFA